MINVNIWLYDDSDLWVQELEQKKMEYIMEKEKDILSSPSLDQYLAR
jgi:hypothetical protein